MVSRTGFWVDQKNTRVLWARDNNSDKRSELWELRVTDSAYEWHDIRDAYRPYGFAGYIGILQYQGYTCVQQPNWFTRNFVQLPKLPYPAGLLAGTTVVDGSWQYVAAVTVEPSADTDGYSIPAFWTCPKTAYTADNVDDLPADDYMYESDGYEPTREELAEADRAMLEPSPVTQEIPEVPPTTNGNAVVIVTMPDMMPAKDCPELQGLGYIRHFRTSQGRKVAYVAAAKGKCVVAYRQRYKRGSDKQLETDLADYVTRLGYTLTACRLGYKLTA